METGTNFRGWLEDLEIDKDGYSLSGKLYKDKIMTCMQCRFETKYAYANDDYCPSRTAWWVAARGYFLFSLIAWRGRAHDNAGPNPKNKLIWYFCVFFYYGTWWYILQFFWEWMWSPGLGSTNLYEYSCGGRDPILQQNPRKWWVFFPIRNDISRHTSSETVILCAS